MPRLPPLPRIAMNRRWMSFLAHAFKAVTQQHHAELVPMFGALVAADAVIFDVGAHAGQFATLFARLAPQGTVFSFEPGRYARSILMLNLAMNRVANVRAYPIGFSDAARTMELRTPIKRSGSLGFGLAHLGAVPKAGQEDSREAGAPGAVVETVQLVTLDDFCRLHAITRLDLIKADIEGWEVRLLTGGEETLARLRPALWIEVVESHLARAGDSIAALRSLMDRHRYAPLRYQAGLGFARLTEIVEGDILWLPIERAGTLTADPEIPVDDRS